MRTLFRIALVLLGLFVGTGCHGGASELAPGRKAPALTLLSSDGRTTTLGEIGEGRVTLLHFFASWCAPCLEELPRLKKLYTTLHHEGLEFVVVAVEDDHQAVTKLVQDLELPFPVYYDDVGQAQKHFKVTGFPESFFLDRDGALILSVVSGVNEPTLRVIGPQDWSSPAMIASLRSLLSH